MNFNAKLMAMAMASLAVASLSSCSDDDTPRTPQGTYTDITNLSGRDLEAEFYLINEGAMGQNKCTIDFVDLDDMRYYANIYAENNPDKVMELGDTGNDAAIHGDRLYIVVNGSHKVEVLDDETCRSYGQIDINSPRNIAFDRKGNGYVTSYVGGTGNKGSLVRFDVRTMQVTGSVSLGYGPEQIAIVGDRAYVVNSVDLSNYTDYDNTMTVVDLKKFEVIGEITVAPNMHHCVADEQGNLWVNSRGDYYTVPSRLYKVVPDADVKKSTVTEVPVAAANFTIAGNYIYLYSSDYNYTTGQSTVTYSCVKRSDCSLVSDAFTEALNSQSDIVAPYGIWYDREDNIMLITDARNYASSGNLIGYDMQGRKVFEHSTGDIPGHIVFE